MTEPAKPPPSRKSRRRLLLLIVPLVLIAVASPYPLAADWRLRRAIAEADRLDPRWRLADIEADRVAIADADNGALTVIAARAKWPANWNTAGPYATKAFGALRPNVALTEQQTAAVRDYVKPAAVALQEARKLADQPRGRWPGPPRSLDALHAAKLLASDVLLRTQEGDLDGALASCRALVNAGRSVGDEPTLMPQMVRLAAYVLAARQVEHVLGQGGPSEAALAALQQLLSEVGEERPLTLALRGERARTDHLLESVQHGDMTVKQLLAATRGPGAKKSLLSKHDLLYLPGVTANSRAATLERWNKLVEISKLPAQEQADRLAELSAPQRDEPLVVLSPASPAVLARYASEAWEQQAPLRCGVVALAAERYRRANGRWPETLADLKGAYLPDVPLDPFDGQPLRYRKDEQGVVVYSIGPDRQDDGGDRTRLNTPNKGADVGFPLWDVAHRCQPPPAPKSAEQPGAVP
jgi:hypothetical protein